MLSAPDTLAPHTALFDPTAPLTPSGNLRRRVAVSRFFEVAATTSALFAVAMLAEVAYTVVSKGAPALSLDFITSNPSGLQGGGIANALIGTAVLVAFGALLALPVGILTGIYLTEFAGP